MPKVLLLEDDYLYAEWLEGEIRDQINAEVEVISTEHDFRTRVEAIAAEPPDVIVVDIMLRWTDPSPDMPQRPPGVGTFHRAGVRCLALLQNNDKTRSIPAIIYSLLEGSDIAPDLREVGLNPLHVHKSTGAEALIRQIQAALRPKKS